MTMTAAEAKQALEQLLLTDPDAELFVEVAEDPRYEASNLGHVRVKSTGQQRPLILHHNVPQARLGEKYRSVHALVARAFDPTLSERISISDDDI